MPARPRVALATCDWLPDLDEDGPELCAALTRAGLDALPVVWSDPGVRWAAFDLVVVRSTWDYTVRREEYLGWSEQIARLENPAAVLRWNTDKRYLAELATAGVPVVPTRWLRPDEAFQPPEGEYVIKPTVGSGAREAARYGPGDDATGHVHRLQDDGRVVMLQPYLPGVDVVGETSMVFVDGALSHVAHKRAILETGVGVREVNSRSCVSPGQATREQVELAVAALAVVPGPAPLLYARVDVVPGPTGAPVVLELELTEPSLFLRHAPGSAERFAGAVCRRIAGMGCGG
ncbi:MAG: hypothetical protein M3N21_01025 [Actinomycetota bacterium]|nr:hypothetical protein [Actinomycetota bacterium]